MESSRRVDREGAMLKILAVAGVGALAWGAARRYRNVSAVHPELRVNALWASFSIGSPVELAIVGRMNAVATKPVDGVTIEQHHIPGGEDVFVYVPEQGERPWAALLWVHGGGLVSGAPEHGHESCSRAARDLGIMVVNARYRLAPEHPFPAAMDDLTAALRWLVSSAGALGIDPELVAVGGSSAGGGLAAGLAQRAHDEGLRLAFQVLVYPMLDDRTVKTPDVPSKGRLVWTARSNRFGWSSYLGHPAGEGESRPYCVPARREDLTGLAPAWIGVGDLDLFHDEDLAYAARLRDADVPVQVYEQTGMYHAGDVLTPVTNTIGSAFRQSWYDALRLRCERVPN